MIKAHSSNYIEIKPVNPFTTMNPYVINESIVINFNEHKFSVVHIRDSRTECKEIQNSLKSMFGQNVPTTKTLELVLVPTKESRSTKTLIHKIVYFDSADLFNDHNKIINYILKGDIIK